VKLLPVLLLIATTLHAKIPSVEVGLFERTVFAQFDGLDADSHAVPMAGLQLTTKNEGPRLVLQMTTTLLTQTFNNASTQHLAKMPNGFIVPTYSTPEKVLSSMTNVSLGFTLPMGPVGIGMGLGRGMYSAYFNPAGKGYSSNDWTYEASVGGHYKSMLLRAGYTWATTSLMINSQGESMIGKLSYDGVHLDLGITF
jgi:hypothetical protein